VIGAPERFTNRSLSAAIVPRAQRPTGLLQGWNAAISDVLDRLTRVSHALTERMRPVDATIAELMAIKQAGWGGGDTSGLERNFYSAGSTSRGLS
jgi:hypothetical protein